jgi:hypothetical protein
MIVLASCGLNAQSAPPSEFAGQNEPPAPPAVDHLIAADDRSGSQDFSSAVQPVETRIVLKNAAITVVVEDAAQTLNDIGALAESSGGWVVTSNTSKVTLASDETVTQGTITVRVPAEKLDDTLNEIRSRVLSVDTESKTGQDVTQDYIDLTSRLNNLRAAETQLQKIMDSADTTESVLNVYNELVRVRGEIETTQGRIRYYDESAAFSSITVTLIPKAIDVPIQIAGWSPGRTAENAIASLIGVLRFAADLLITIGLLVVPLLLIFVLPGWLIYRTLLRRGIINPRRTYVHAQPTASEAPPEE